MLDKQRDQTELSDLLTRIIGQKVHENHVSHRLLLVTTLLTSLIGVIYADNKIDESEKEILKSTLDEFIPSSSHMRKLVKPILVGLSQNKTYLRKDDISKMSFCLTTSDKLLIIGLCYRLANADGELAKPERDYIEAISKIFGIDSQYLPFLTGSLNNQELSQSIKFEINSLLDPHNFQHIDPTFAQAADLLRQRLLLFNKEVLGSAKATISYDQLIEFKQLHSKLLECTLRISELINQGVEQEVLAPLLKDKVRHTLERASSKRFRLAVVGEFSQGKSTLLNALIGEEVQPTRAIPCSGVVTVLRHGDQHRVICRYNDNREEEVNLEDYQALASISEESALSSISEELTNSEIHEIIFEHPQLELCKNQVEIVDSPGLNEHPNRSKITLQVLENTDAIIFMLNASRLLTEGEKKLLTSIKEQIQGDNLDTPVENIFVVVNFMDLLRNESNKRQVIQRANNFLCGELPLIQDQDRLHFISAQAALDEILSGTTSGEYLKDFRKLVGAIETFLAKDRGSIMINQIKGKLEDLLEETLIQLKQSLNVVEGKIKISQSDRDQIIEHIGDASGWEVKLRFMYEEILEESLDLVGNSFGQWIEAIPDRIAERSADWTSQADEKSEILKDFSNQFVQDLSLDLNSWLEQVVKQDILVSQINEFDRHSSEALESIYENLQSVDLISGSNLGEQFSLSLKDFGVRIDFVSRLDPSSIEDTDSFIDSLAFVGGSSLLGGALAFFGVGLLPILLGSFAAGAVINWLFGTSPEEVVVQMKQEVYEKGFEKFFETTEEIGEKIGQGVFQAITSRYENSKKAIEYSISILNSILQDQEFSHCEAMDSSNKKGEFIRLKIDQVYELESQLRDFKNF